jgi:hypothetical protein
MAVVLLALDCGDGDFIAGMTSCLGILPFSSPVLLTVAGLVGIVAFLLGRLLGTTVISIISFGLMIYAVVDLYPKTLPLARFRDLVWKSAPASLAVLRAKASVSFSDGMTRAFTINCDEATINQMAIDVGFTKAKDSSERSEVVFLFNLGFDERKFPPDAQYYHHRIIVPDGRDGEIGMVFVPSEKPAYVVYLPSLPSTR